MHKENIMEYVQMTLNDWVEMKQRLRQELLGVKQSFVRIGYALRQIDDQKLYEQDGYKSVAEFAKAEYGLEPSTTSRFIAINREYSIDGYSEHLRPEYAGLGRSQLEEMLKLPEEDRSMIQPEASRQSIRDLKAFNRSGPKPGEAEDPRQLVEEYFRGHKEELDEYYGNRAEGPGDEVFLKEVVNPSGNKSFRKGMYFLMMYEKNIQIKKFGAAPQEMSWGEFYRLTEELFNPGDGANTYRHYFGLEEQEAQQEEPDKKGPEEKKQEKKREEPDGYGTKSRKAEGKRQAGGEASGEATEKRSHGKPEPDAKEDPGNRKADAGMEKADEGGKEGRAGSEMTAGPEAIAPAQNKKEYIAPVIYEEPAEPEIIEKTYGTRKAYIDSLTAEAAARYLFENMQPSYLVHLSELNAWLLQEVDNTGESI